MNWRSKPLLRPLLFLIVGILLGSYFPIFSPFVFISLMLPFLLLFAYLQNSVLPRSFQKYFGAFISFFFLLLGSGAISLTQPIHNSYHLIHQHEETLTAIAEVNTAPSIKNKISVNLKMITKIGQEENRKLEGKLIAYFPLSEANKEISVGDIIKVKLKTYAVQKNKNPYAFDFSSYYANKGIYHQASVIDWQSIKKSKGLFQGIQSRRQQLLKTLSIHLPTVNEYAVGAALCLGSKDFLSKELKNEYANTGAMHVLAISGLHVGIVFSFIFFVFSSFKTRNKFLIYLKIGITIILLWTYALFTGGSPSVLRAALMFSFITAALYLRHNSDTYNTLAAAAICLLLYDPNLIFDVGFQLSFTAVAGIVYFQPRIYSLLYFPWKAPDYLWQISSVGIAAQLATFPIGLYYFHQLPIYFLLTGLFVIPFAYMILFFSVLLFISQSFSATLALWIGKILYALIWINNALIHMVSSLPGDSMNYIFIGLFSLLLFYICVYFIDLYTKRGTAIALGASLVLVFSLTFVFTNDNIINANSGYLCVYHTKKGSLSDIGLETDLVSNSDGTVDPADINFTAGNLRKFHGSLEESSPSTLIQTHKHISMVGSKRICFHQNDSLPTKKIDIDYLILDSSLTESISQLKEYYNFDKLIFDNSVSMKQRLAWVKDCRSLGIAYHDVRRGGAFYEVFD